LILSACNGFIDESLSVEYKSTGELDEIVKESEQMFTKLGFSCSEKIAEKPNLSLNCTVKEAGNLGSRTVEIKALQVTEDSKLVISLKDSSVTMIPSYMPEFWNDKVNALRELAKLLRKKKHDFTYAPSAQR
jgi:hypothetical protein